MPDCEHGMARSTTDLRKFATPFRGAPLLIGSAASLLPMPHHRRYCLVRAMVVPMQPFVGLLRLRNKTLQGAALKLSALSVLHLHLLLAPRGSVQREEHSRTRRRRSLAVGLAENPSMGSNFLLTAVS